MSSQETPSQVSNFIAQIIDEDIKSGKTSQLVTRFPPEPNGYLHIGHAKSICVNFGLAEQFGGVCNLRFDDTNPSKEEQEFVDAIKADVRWLGFEWNDEVRYASDYFDQFYDWAQHLIREGKAYVCDLSPEQTSDYRGDYNTLGKPSPYRGRSVEENLDLLERMKNGEFEDGAKVLRAKIDMTSPNMILRDPVMYRILRQSHHQTGDKWNIYPTYDFAHGQEDAIEGVTHSICTMEFADHKPLYEWFLDNLPVPAKPAQYEFGRLNLSYTLTSKRKLKQLVDDNVVSGWDDPRMPTISGLRRRGFSAHAIRSFCNALPVAKAGGVVDVAQFESAVRDDLDKSAPRAMCVLDPVKLIVTNFGGLNQVNINTADVNEFIRVDPKTKKKVLYRIATEKAKAIIKYREEHGLFESIDDLVNVSGIAETLVEKNRDVLVLNDPKEILSAPAHPKIDLGERQLPFTAELYIDRADFSEDSTLSRKKFKRLVLGEYVRLRGAYVIKADDVIKDDAGEIVEIKASLVPGTVGENPPEGMKPRGVIHWVSATEGRQATVRVYDRLFNHPAPESKDENGESDFMQHLNHESFRQLDNCWVEPGLASAAPESGFQFEREGYFVADRYDHCSDKPVFNMTSGLRDTWANK
ncbi:MAG: glutamine--tRNA ligase/YqeY domain fusion protein [Halopseudomonas sp.]